MCIVKKQQDSISWRQLFRRKYETYFVSFPLLFSEYWADFSSFRAHLKVRVLNFLFLLHSIWKKGLALVEHSVLNDIVAQVQKGLA